jgi:hypothetical protein
LRQGVFDAQENPIPTIYGDKLFEVQKTINLTGHVWSYNVISANSQFLASLKPEQRKIFDETLKESVDWLNTAVATETDDLLVKMKAEQAPRPSGERHRLPRHRAPIVDKFAQANCRPGPSRRHPQGGALTGGAREAPLASIAAADVRRDRREGARGRPAALFGVLERIVEAVALGAFILMMLATLLQVAARYLHIALDWTEEFARILFLSSIMIGIALAIRRREHIVVDFPLRHFSRRAQAGFSAFFDLVILGLLGRLAARRAPPHEPQRGHEFRHRAVVSRPASLRRRGGRHRPHDDLHPGRPRRPDAGSCVEPRPDR